MFKVSLMANPLHLSILLLIVIFSSCKDEENTAYDCIDGNCQSSTNGTYATLADCQAACTGGGGYDCVDGACQAKANGAYATLADCQNDCNSNVTYNCVSGNCVTATNATYSSLVDCQNNCSSGSCPSTFTDPRDGQTYNVVQIGNQCWFAENLNYTTGNSWCYENNTANCNVYGRLYDWQTALTACPDGWHLPSYDEWITLSDYLGGANADDGGKMKSTTGWNPPNTGATNSSGFTGLPGGLRGSNTIFINIGQNGHWWSSTEHPNTFDGRSQFLSFSNSFASLSAYPKASGFSCRCLKD